MCAVPWLGLFCRFLQQDSSRYLNFTFSGDKVKLPGPSADRPNVYDFGTSYEEIHADLKKKDKTMYTQNGILNMLDRNRRIKYAPQRLQESKHKYDVIFTAEERVYDQCIEHFENTGNVRLVYL